MNAIPAGYKQSEAGVIPEDWASVKLGSHVEFRTGPFGSALHKSDYVEHGIPVINPMQIIGGKILPTPSMAISEQAARKLAIFRLSAGNIVIGRRGEMGRCAFVREEHEGWLCGTGSMIIRVMQSIDASFLQRVLSSPSMISAIESSSVGSTMINLNQGTLGNLIIPLPPTKAEQEAIAEALNDADTLIESLVQLVAKKRYLKQAATPDLLTGRKRLPGFDTIRVFAITKLSWIKSQQKKLCDQERETPREYLDRESHYVWGKRYLLKLVEKDASPTAEIKHNKLVLQLRPATSHAKRQEVLDAWYRDELKEAVPPLIAKWEKVIGVKAKKFFVQKMKTKWGSCNPSLSNIRINTDLAKKPLQCLEYIVAHELTHLLERRHNDHFTALMDAHMPQWRQYREMLNSLPLAHQEWKY